MNSNFEETPCYENIISYAPFWRTLEKKKISQYDLVNNMDFSSSMLQKLRRDKPITLKSIAMICSKLNIHPSDVFMFYLKGDKPRARNQQRS